LALVSGFKGDGNLHVAKTSVGITGLEETGRSPPLAGKEGKESSNT